MKIIPTDPKRRQHWLDIIKRPELVNAKGSAVCEVCILSQNFLNRSSELGEHLNSEVDTIFQ